MTIRPVTPGDMQRVGEIAIESWAGIHEVQRRLMGAPMHTALRGTWRVTKLAEVNSAFNSRPECFLVAENEGQLLGFITFQINAANKVGEIGNNAVAPAGRGRGVGTALCRHVLDIFCRQGLRYAKVVTGLDEGHAAARRMYEKVGFDIQIPSVTYYMTLEHDGKS